MAKCAYHPKADAVGACVSCGRLVCAEFKVELQGKIYCNPCANKIIDMTYPQQPRLSDLLRPSSPCQSRKK